MDDTYSIFVSHAAIDEELAVALKKAIIEQYPTVRVFVSSDPEDLAPGDPWVEKILNALKTAEFVFVLTTERGLSRKWVWFEVGRTWFTGIVTIPICVGKIRKSNLLAPFSGLQGLNIDDARDAEKLFRTLEGRYGKGVRQIDAAEFTREMIRLDVRAEERGKALSDPFTVERRKSIEVQMKKFSPAERETFRQFVLYGELTTGAARIAASRTGLDMSTWSAPEHLGRQTGWIVPKQGNKPFDDMEQNCFTINSIFKGLLEDYFSSRPT
jgi:hypothetical protein